MFIHIYTDEDVDTDTDIYTKETWHIRGYTMYIDTAQIHKHRHVIFIHRHRCTHRHRHRHRHRHSKRRGIASDTPYI